MWQKIMFVALYISGSIHHIIVIFGTHVQNDNISRCLFHFFWILIFRVFRELKGKKWPQMKKILSLSLHISGTVHHMIVFWHTCLKWYLHLFSTFFKIVIFWAFWGKGQKMTHNYQFWSVTLYLKNCWSYHQDFGIQM